MVEDIECFKPKFQFEPIVKCNVAEQGQVVVPVPRAAQGINSGSSIGAIRGEREGRRVKPFAELVRRARVRIADEVDSLLSAARVGCV